MDERRPGHAAAAPHELPGDVVFEGAHRDTTWQVRVHGDDTDLRSMLHLYRGSTLLDGSGMGGPPLPAGALFTGMRGYSDHAPAQVLVRTHPDVISVVVTTERNLQVLVTLSGVIAPRGLCFGVAVLDESGTTGGLSVYTAQGEQHR